MKQLDVACELNLWTEAFNILNDLRVIMSRKSWPAEDVISYYENVSRIFWELKHYFYHAYAQIRLLAARKRQDGVSEEDLRANYAQVCLAVLVSHSILW